MADVTCFRDKFAGSAHGWKARTIP